MLADEVDYVLGVDTHRDEHVVAVVTAPAGAVVAGKSGRANARGYRDLLRLAEQYAAGRRVWAIEGTGSYGLGLARYLAEHGEVVLEVSRTRRTERRLRGKDDALDAARTARAALAADTLVMPRTGERREALRLLLVARRSAVDVRREALSQLRAVIVTAPRAAPPRAPRPANRQAARPLQPPPPDELERRPTRNEARAPEPGTSHPSRHTRSRRARTRTARPRARARTRPARRARRRTSRRRPADHRLVTPRPAAFRSLLRAPRRRRTRPRLERTNTTAPAQPRRRSPAQPRAAHDRAASTSARPGNAGVHRATRRRGQEPPRSDPTAQALPRPPPLPAAPTHRAARDLTTHRSIIPRTSFRASDSCRGCRARDR